MKKATTVILLLILLACPVHTTGGPFSDPATPTDIGPADKSPADESPPVFPSSPMEERPTRIDERQESVRPSSPKEEYKEETPVRVVAEPPPVEETTPPVEETIIPEPITEAPTPTVKPKTVAKKKPIVVQLFDKDMNPLSIEINTELIGEYGALIWVDELECFISVKKGR